MNNHHIITIGTSAGGIRALKTLVSQLPKDFPASIHIVQHLPSESRSNLPQILNKAGQLPVAFAKDGELIESGRIYLAPPDFHMTLEKNYIRVIRGPRENRVRPAVDPLFRSAAVTYKSYVTGVILTGMLDDGTAGLQAIKTCGGMAIVQDPDEAEFNSMPKSAIANVEVDWVVPLSGIANILIERVRQTPPMITEIPENLRIEASITKNGITEPEIMDRIGQPVFSSCPSCGGRLWQIGHNSPLRYRCHTGHAFTSSTLLTEQNEATEKALWIALRTLEERGRLLENMSKQYAQKGSNNLANIHQARSQEAFEHAMLIRNLIYNLKDISVFSTEEKPKQETS
ncbi:CheB methylesterase [Stanieria cyanosphaera PCC 7437]|uniref:protein-glutamate methylesterase n=1 Tax=Stanieria cyanosphaera (strain ATCC 29371 / PCC 7437) TaxID=111780 RepID=K9XR07_STAC7|nr:chemotaxis protein CheB [Stanieria cyanosphaera]AFZ34968.1 CheB methylesterase [Stanieria cyanosphaera PCC 7437]